MDQYHEIQENLFEYFDNIPDKLFSDFIDSFVYMKPASDNNVSKLAEKFLEDMELVDIFCRYEMDIKEPKTYFNRCTTREVEFMNQIRMGLLSLAFNRFRRIV